MSIRERLRRFFSREREETLSTLIRKAKIETHKLQKTGEPEKTEQLLSRIERILRNNRRETLAREAHQARKNTKNFNRYRAILDFIEKLESVVLTRRVFLKGAAGTLIASTAAAKAAQAATQAEETQADRFFREFPGALEHGRVEKTLSVAGAKHCLVHIRQHHMLSMGTYVLIAQTKFKKTFEDATVSEKDQMIEYIRDMCNETNRVQKDIYHILRELQGRIGLRSVRAEGYLERKRTQYTPETIREQYSLFLFVLELCSIIHPRHHSTEEKLSDLISDLRVRLERKRPDLNWSLQPKYRQFLYYELYVQMLTTYHPAQTSLLSSRYLGAMNQEEFKYIYGGESLLGLQDMITVLPAEIGTAQMDGAGAEFLSELYIDQNIEGREDELLELIARDNEPLTVATYGWGHDWLNVVESAQRISTKSNIARWNNEHPDNKFSLITVVPKSYQLR